MSFRALCLILCVFGLAHVRGKRQCHLCPTNVTEYASSARAEARKPESEDEPACRTIPKLS